MASRLALAVNKFTRPLVFGMIHVPALPGTPLNRLNVTEIDELVRHEANIYRETKVDGVILENMHDLPYAMGSEVGPETTALMTRYALAAKSVFCDAGSPSLTGIQILAGANRQALAVALAAGLDFIRAECFVFAHVADEGVMNACAADLLRFRRSIDAEQVAIITDIKKKHSAHAITADVSIGEVAHAAEFFLADGVVVTGTATGQEADPQEVEAVTKACGLPVFVGSGVTADTVKKFSHAQGLIVGSHFKKHGQWQNELDKDRIQTFMEKLNS